MRKTKNLRVPNKRTRRAIKQARAGKGVETFDSVSAWAKKVRAYTNRDQK